MFTSSSFVPFVFRRGTLTYVAARIRYNNAPGDVYRGGYKDDKRHGPGTLTHANGDVDDLVYRDGELVSQTTAPERRREQEATAAIAERRTIEPRSYPGRRWSTGCEHLLTI